MKKNKIKISKSFKKKRKYIRHRFPPKQRIIRILKREKTMPLTPLSKKTSIQYDVLKKILSELEKEKLINIIISKIDRGKENFIIVSEVKWIGYKNERNKNN